MKKRFISSIMTVSMFFSMISPAMAYSKVEDAILTEVKQDLAGYVDSCILEDGTELRAEYTDDQHLLISQYKDGVLIESTETDYDNQEFIYTTYNKKGRSTGQQIDKIEDIVEAVKADKPTDVATDSGDIDTRAGTYHHFANVTFRTQIGTDYYKTPEAWLYVKYNKTEDVANNTVHVDKISGGVTKVISAFSIALGLLVPQLGAVESFLIGLTVLVGGEVSNAISVVTLESQKRSETIRGSYSQTTVDFAQGATIKATGNTNNGKHKNQTFYDGICE